MIGQVFSYIHSDGKWIPCVVLWVLWRTWMFTIRPRLPAFRDEVDVLPYNMPFIGHAISLFRDPLGLYEYAHKYFGETRKPYAIHTASQITVIITSPDQAAEILNNEDSYTSDPFLDTLYRTVGGVSIPGSQILWKKTATKTKTLLSSLVHKCHDLLLHQLQGIPSKKTQETNISSRILCLMNRAPSAAEIGHTTDKSTKVVSLHRWCRDVLIKTQMDLFFGPWLIEEIEPDATSVFDSFDAKSWMLAYQYPSFLAGPATMPRENLVRALETYLDTSAVTEKQDENGHAPLFAPVIGEMKGAGLSHEDCARVLLVMFWEINSTVQMTAFWMLVHLLRPENKRLVDIIRKEIAPMMTNMTSMLIPKALEERKLLHDLSTFDCNITDSSKCPVINSLHAEVMRVFNISAPIRVTTRPVSLSNFTQSNSESKVIPANTKIVLPQRMIALSPELYGPKADHVDPCRFVSPNSNKTLVPTQESLVVGTTLAQSSAKTVGKSAVLGFVASVLWRFDLEAVPEGRVAKDGKAVGMRVPGIALTGQSLGVGRQIDGDDVIVEVRNRGQLHSERD